MDRKGLKLFRLRLFENNIFDDLDIVFFDKENSAKEPFTSLIIGPNGTGKSNLLRIIILLFQELDEFKKSGKRVARFAGKFHFEYYLNGIKFQYFNAEFSENKSGKIVNEIEPEVRLMGDRAKKSDIGIPESIIATSIMLTDKFPTGISAFKAYNYLGVKYNSNTARTTTFIRRTVESLFKTLDNQLSLSNIKIGLKFLAYDPYLYISYTPRYKHIIFQESLKQSTFENFFLKFWEYTRRKEDSPPWSFGAFKRLKKNHPEKIPKLVKLCRKIKSSLQKVYPGSRSEFFGFDIFDMPYTNEELGLINELYALDLISYPSISFRKQKKEFEIEDSSSGEYHFISGFIGLLATIQKNSLVLIDEPENSLHPNWQMKYISFLKSVFSKFKSCHFVVATHSHFMVSDLNGLSSTLVALSKNGKVEANLIPSNTYGWSAEEILLNVFQTPSTRNFYLSEELGEIFRLISEEPSQRNLAEIKKRITKLKQLDLSGLSKEDPLKDVLSELFKKFSNA